jgi:L-alanine-DL-glutamate epimerase-like enolase superfamily enzyme
MQQWILQGATDMLRGDVAVVGGITPLMKIANLADAFRMNCEIHHGGNSLNNVANLHVTLAIDNCEYFEVLLPDEVQKFGLLDDIMVDKNGLIHAPKGPGLGYAIDWDLVKQTQISELR